MLNKSRQPLLGKDLKTIFSNAKERKFCIWRAAEERLGGPSQRGTRMAGMTQPWSWARLGLEQAANIPGLLEKLFNCPLILPFVSRMKYRPRGFSTAPPECDSESEEQGGFVVSEQSRQTTFAVPVFFLQVSAWPGRFFSAWEGWKASEVVGYILTALLTHPPACCRQILEHVSGCPIPCNLPESKDFLQEGGGEASGRGSSPTESCSKDLEGEREINTNIFQEECLICVFIVISEAHQAGFW